MKNFKNNETSSGTDSSVIKNVLSRGTIHGIKYLLDEETTFYEKLFWMLVFTSAFIGAALHLRTIWITYDTNLTRTTIVSTYFKYANIPFPSVTVCDSSRADWTEIDTLNMSELMDSWDGALPISSNNYKMKMDLRKLIAALSTAQFGAPKDLSYVQNFYNLKKLKEVPVSQLLRRIVRSCDEIFEARCWWRTSYYNCCDLFELQKTGYGFCYSFNSDISEKSKELSLNYGMQGEKNQWKDWNNQVRPRRSAGHGPWSGLRFQVKSQNIPRHVNVKPGIVVIVGDPSGFPFENDVFVASGKIGNIGVRGDTVITTERLRRLSFSQRRCLFPDEERILFRGYLRQNCIANCYRKFVQSNCKCVLDFVYYQIELYNTSKYLPCKVKHLKCIAEYNYAFNSHLSDENIEYDQTKESNSFCNCPDDCINQKYIAKLSTRNMDSAQKAICDVHYERSFCTLYRTDLGVDYMDVLVAYGGIFVLFLGASLLSIIEISYHTIKIIFHILPQIKRRLRISSSKSVKPLFFERDFIKNRY